MKHLKIVTLVAFSFVLLSSFESNAQKQSSTKTIAEATKTTTKTTNEGLVEKTYKLKGFKQSCCTGIVNYSLKEVNGFVKSAPNVKQQELTVWFDKSKTTEADIEKAINKTPYKIVN